MSRKDLTRTPPTTRWPARPESSEPVGWLEVEDIDPDTGELLGTHRQHLDADGDHRRTHRRAAAGRTLRAAVPTGVPAAAANRPDRHRGAPLAACSASADTPGELADRSAMMPADQIRALIADTLQTTRDGQDPRDQILFTRLLTDHGGRLLDTTELGRYPSRRLAEAIRLRAGTCCHPTCTVPADLCDIDHHQPATPTGPPPATTATRPADDTTAAAPSPGKPPSATTTASTGPCPTPNATDVSTSRCPSEAPAGLTTKPSTRRHTFGARRPSDKTQTRRRGTLPGRLDPGVEIGRPVSRWGRRCRSRDRSARGA